jgi:transposase
VLRGMLGARVRVLRPRDPESKGLVERAIGYLETSFLPGRRFAGVADFDAQLGDWLGGVNLRRRRVLDGAAPADRIGADRAAMLALPPIDVTTIGWRHTLRLGRDHYVRLDSCDYSVHPSAIGHRVEVAADLHTLTVHRGGTLVGRHERSWARHQTITDPVHARAAAAMRQAYLDRPRGGLVDEVAARDLADYDRILGIAGGDDLDEVA